MSARRGTSCAPGDKLRPLAARNWPPSRSRHTLAACKHLSAPVPRAGASPGVCSSPDCPPSSSGAAAEGPSEAPGRQLAGRPEAAARIGRNLCAPGEFLGKLRLAPARSAPPRRAGHDKSINLAPLAVIGRPPSLPRAAPRQPLRRGKARRFPQARLQFVWRAVRAWGKAEGEKQWGKKQ